MGFRVSVSSVSLIVEFILLKTRKSKLLYNFAVTVKIEAKYIIEAIIEAIIIMSYLLP